MQDLIDNATGKGVKPAFRHRRSKPSKHLWGPGRPVPGEKIYEYKRHSCRRCGKAGKSFPGNPAIVADQPGGCW